MSRPLAALLIALLVLAGCTTGPGMTGRFVDEPVLCPQVGGTIPAARFKDEEGRMRNLSDLDRDVTLLALVPVDGTGLCEQLEELSAAAVWPWHLPYAYVRVVVVGQASARTAAECDVCLSNLTYIEAPETCASLWSGIPTSGKWFVVDRRGRITAQGPVSDLSSVHLHLDAAVSTCWSSRRRCDARPVLR